MIIKGKVLIAICFVFIGLIFTVLQFEKISWNPMPRGDQVAFLETAIRIKEAGGIVKLLPNMFTGTYREANRHPLYVALISPIAKRELAFFWQAKLITYIISLTFLSILAFMMIKLKGYRFALLISLLFAVNGYFLEHSATISTEPLLMIFIILSWHFIVNDFQSSEKKTMWAGVFSGLAFLSKITAIFIIPAYLLVAFITKRKNAFNRHLLIFFGAFLIVTLPLLWRNVLVFRNPIYNYNSKLVFIDIGEQRRTLETLSGETPSAFTYIRTHSVGEILSRLIVGAIQESVVISQILLFGYARIRASIILTILLIIAFFRDKNRQRALFSFFLTFAFYMFFSWYYKISGHYRYVLPIIFILYFYLISLGFTFTKWFWDKYIKVKVSPVSLKLGAILVSFLILVNSYVTYGFISPINSVDPSLEFRLVRDWVKENISSKDKYINGPGHEYQVEWLTGTADQSIEMPVLESFAELEDFIKEKNIKYAIVSIATYNGRERVLEEHFKFRHGEGLLIKKENPVDWKKLDEDPRIPYDYFIFGVGE